MTALVVRKLGALLVTVVIASMVIFAAMLATPGDPASALAGGARPTPEMMAQIKAQYHLDDPVWLQYVHWISDVARGDLGSSFVYKTDVSALIAPRVGVTLMLVVYATILIALIGVGAGVLAGMGGRRADRLVLISTSVGMAMPTFVVAIVLIWVFSRSLGWFPVYGAGSGFADQIRHLTLPAVSMAVLYIAFISRITRGSIVAQKNSEHVETAQVRGIGRGRIFRAHIFHNAAPQILSVAGVTVGGLFATSAIAEQAFGIGGLGSLLTDAASRKDLPVVQILALLLVTLFVVLNAVTDLAIAVIDPASQRM